MITEKKFLIFSIFAIIIGVSSILPVGYFLFAPVKGEIVDEPWFSVNIPYSYLEAKNGTFQDFEYPEAISMNETEVESYGFGTFLNLTLDANLETENVDARIEYFQIQLTSNIGLIEKRYQIVGTNSNISFGYEDFHFKRDGWFDTNQMSGGGLLKYNWTLGESILWPNSGASSSTISPDSEVTKIREADRLFVTVYRLGWVTFDGNSTTIIKRVNDIVAQIELTKYNEGLLFNNLIPEEDLPKIDLWHPIPYEDMIS